MLSPPELAAARAAFERTWATEGKPFVLPGRTREPTGPARSNVEGKPIREPALEQLVRLCPHSLLLNGDVRLQE